MSLLSIFNDSQIMTGLWVILVSMIPTIECKGAIPLGLSGIWGSNALSLWQSFCCGLIGSLVLILLIVFLYNPIMRVLKRKRLYKRSEEILHKAFFAKFTAKYNLTGVAKYRKILFLFLFTAMPLPGSGVWTSGLLGCLMKLRKIDIIICVFLGNIVDCLVVICFSGLFIEYIDMFLVAFLIESLIFIAYKIIMICIKHKEQQKRVA